MQLYKSFSNNTFWNVTSTLSKTQFIFLWWILLLKVWIWDSGKSINLKKKTVIYQIFLKDILDSSRNKRGQLLPRNVYGYTCEWRNSHLWMSASFLNALMIFQPNIFCFGHLCTEHLVFQNQRTIKQEPDKPTSCF